MKEVGSIKERMINHLKQSILVMDLAPGQDLDEVALSESFGISRTPLREVLRHLAGEGYIELRAHRGGRVTDMNYRTLRDFFLSAPMIYSAILSLAAANAKPKQIQALEQAQRQFVKCLKSGNASDCALANNQFHEITGDMADNPYLQPSFKRLLIDHARIGVTFYRASHLGVYDEAHTACAHHDAIIEAVKNRDSKEASALSEAHWNLSRHQMEIFFMPDALDFSLSGHNPFNREEYKSL